MLIVIEYMTPDGASGLGKVVIIASHDQHPDKPSLPGLWILGTSALFSLASPISQCVRIVISACGEIVTPTDSNSVPSFEGFLGAAVSPVE
jgi:hypothetical protein